MEDVQQSTDFQNNMNSERKDDYYVVLGCSRDATYQELKRSYQYLIKKYHPDKQHQEGRNSLSDSVFVLIDKAFKTLRNEKTRKEYDASLLQDTFSENYLIYAELAKNDLHFTDNIFYYPCRCGINFEISTEVLSEEECVIECSECTNCILIK